MRSLAKGKVTLGLIISIVVGVVIIAGMGYGSWRNTKLGVGFLLVTLGVGGAGLYKTHRKRAELSRVIEQQKDELEIRVCERTKELEEAKRDLEKRVDGRTKELQQKYAELSRSQTATLYMVEDLNRQAKELREAQDAIIRSEKLAAIGQLASSVAHELRNPLGVIKNALYYFEMLELGKDNADIKENMDIMSKEIENSNKIISDLLEFSRIKKPSLHSENINIIVKEILNRIEKRPDIEIITELEDTLPNIKVDALQIQQVFYNIATNAVQSMNKGGRLMITTALITANKKLADIGVSKSAEISVSFKDTGSGISKENLDKIFSPLFSTRPKGTGLGLSVCASLIEGHAGTIEVQSEVEKGTTFVVKLPINKGD